MAGVTVPASSAHALDPFIDGTASLENPMLSSGVAIAVADMNSDGRDDIVRLDDTQSLEIEYQAPDGTFELLDYGPISGSSWAIAIADADGNGYPDIFTGGAYDGLKLLLADDGGVGYTLGFVTGGPSIFVQCANFADIDNNGTLDLFMCHDDGLSHAYSGDGTGEFTYSTGAAGLINPVSTVPSDNSGNYGSVWTDYDNDGDLDMYLAKCRLGITNAMDGRRLNLLFQNDGKGNYTDVAEAAGLRPLDQSWASDFGDIDNDGDFDVFLVTHEDGSNLYENLGPDDMGTFADITAASGMTTTLNSMGLGIQTHFEDFDNDTFIDLLVTGRSGQHRLYMNNGDNTFENMATPFPTGGPGIQSAAVGDMNDDGFPDVIAGFATGFNQPSAKADQLFLNAGNENGWINIILHGVESNATAVGARLELTGEWGTQIREVRAGESYGINNSATRHFGIGAAKTIDGLVIRWPSGHVDMAENLPINTTVHITEGCPDVFYPDTDGDGFGDPAGEITACLLPTGHSVDNTDCDDADGNNFPGNEEVCDGLDNNCDGTVDEGFEEVCGGGTSSGGDETTGPADGPNADDSTSAPPPPPPDPQSTSDAGSDSTGGPMEMGSDDGCGCVVDDSRNVGWFGLILVGLFASRRRRD